LIREENSVDAGCGRIDIAVEQGGIELIRVVDDGCGIQPADLSLAFANHATSKKALLSVRVRGVCVFPISVGLVGFDCLMHKQEWQLEGIGPSPLPFTGPHLYPEIPNGRRFTGRV
jgi:Histidine kinase-, DNA gyrase B-, and HSP90-like ATPase